MESLCRGHIGTLETVFYIEVVLDSIQLTLSVEDTLGGNCPLYRGCP